MSIRYGGQFLYPLWTKVVILQ